MPTMGQMMQQQAGIPQQTALQQGGPEQLPPVMPPPQGGGAMPGGQPPPGAAGAPDFQQGAGAFEQQQQQGVLDMLQQRHQQVSIDSATLRLGRALIKGVTDQPTFEVFKRLVGVMWGPQAAMAFGQRYEEAKPQLAAILAHSALVRRHASAHARSLTLAQRALAGGADAPALWKGAVGSALSTARDDDEWRGIIGEMQNAGAPADVLNGFDTVYSPEAAQNAQAMGGQHILPDYE